MGNRNDLSEAAKYTAYGILFGLIFPAGSLLFLASSGMLPRENLADFIVAAHRAQSLLYLIDTTPLLFGLIARLAGIRQDRLKAFSFLLEQEVASKTVSLRQALEEARQANQKIQEMAQRDALTGLNNRRAFQSELERWVAYATRHQRPLAILFVDLDRFKWVNDTYGHGAGDKILVRVAGLLKDALRCTDCLGRWGGDEFVALLPETNVESAAGVAARIIGQFQRATAPLAGREIRLSASIGIAAFPEHGAEARLLLDRADAAMYRSKQREKGGFVIFSLPAPAAASL